MARKRKNKRRKSRKVKKGGGGIGFLTIIIIIVILLIIGGAVYYFYFRKDDSLPPEMPDDSLPPEMPDEDMSPEMPDEDMSPEMPDEYIPPEMPDEYIPPEMPDEDIPPEIPDEYIPPEMPDEDMSPEMPDEDEEPEEEVIEFTEPGGRCGPIVNLRCPGEETCSKNSFCGLIDDPVHPEGDKYYYRPYSKYGGPESIFVLPPKEYDRKCGPMNDGKKCRVADVCNQEGECGPYSTHKYDPNAKYGGPKSKYTISRRFLK